MGTSCGYCVAHSVPIPFKTIWLYLNHSINTHYHVNFMCGTCLSAVTLLGQQMKRHISECPGLPALPEKSSQGSTHSERSPKKCTHGSSSSKSKDGGSKSKQNCQSGKSQPGEATSQEDSQTSNRHLTCAAGVGQESTTGSSQCHSSRKKENKEDAQEEEVQQVISSASF